ncbi:hypothetical protein [Salinibacter ruber]|uniref:hypothetical protein n=1 Tax=Salinibacter ruber TaxID=146919 RepID=UPI000E58A2F8|nr:hypothetical protein [Salinibacter ruber]
MTARFSFWPQIAAWGFLLNMVWEFGQCLFLYDMWSWGFWRGAGWMWGAIFGDVLIVLGVAALARLAVGPAALDRMSWRAWVSLLWIGLVASIGLEWAARALGFWGYSVWMPTVTVLGHTVGLSPIVQVTMLPALSVALAQRRSQEPRDS